MGIAITSVVPNSPAAKAKLKPGDILTHFNKIPIKTDKDIINLAGNAKIGSKVSVNFLRNNKKYSTYLRIEKDPLKQLPSNLLNQIILNNLILKS